MQSFSPCLEGLGSSVILAAAKPADPAAAWNDLVATHGVATLLFFFLASFITGILSIWVGSLATAGKLATFGRALLTWLGWMAAMIVVAICAALGFSLALSSGNRANLVIGVVLLGVLTLMVLFGVPMSVYQFGPLRSLGMILITGVTNWVGQFCLELAFFGGDILNRPDTIRRWVAETRQQKAPAAVHTDLLQRKDALVRRHEALEIRRRHLPPNDAQALADYQRDVATYERDLARLREDTAARLSPP